MTAPLDSTALANLEEFGSDAMQDGLPYVRFTKGEFLYGVEETIVDEDEEFAVNVASVSRGWICWKDGKPVDEVMATAMSGKVIQESSLPDHGPYDEDGDGWRSQASVEFVSLDTGERLRFSTSTHGGRKAVQLLTKAYIDHVKAGLPGEVPVVNMVPDNYRHEKYGKVHVPTFPVKRWLNQDGSELDDDTGVPFDGGTVIEAEPEPEPTKRQSVRTRRRSAKA